MKLTIKSDTIDISITDNYSTMIAVLKALQASKVKNVDVSIYDGRFRHPLFCLQNAIDTITEDYE